MSCSWAGITQAPVQAGGGKRMTWGTSCPWDRNVPLWQRRPMASGAAFGRASPAGPGRWSPPSPQLPHSWSAQRRHGYAGLSPPKGQEDDKRPWTHLTYEEWLRELRLFSLEKEAQGGFYHCMRISAHAAHNKICYFNFWIFRKLPVPFLV